MYIDGKVDHAASEANTLEIQMMLENFMLVVCKS